MPPPLPRSSVPALLLLLVALTVFIFATTSAKIALENGDVFANIKYTSETTYDANAKLKDETAHSSTVLWKSCTVSNNLKVEGTINTAQTFATSLYLLLDTTIFKTAGQVMFIDLPPNTYINAVNSLGSDLTMNLYVIHATGQAKNVTVMISSTVAEFTEYASERTPMRLLNFWGSNYLPHLMIHVRDAKLFRASSVLQVASCTSGSTVFVENIICTKCSQDIFLYQAVEPTIIQQSAFILRWVTIVDHSNVGDSALFRAADALRIDKSSVFSLVDIDVTNDFRTTNPLPLFADTKISGSGTVVLLRIKMGPSGLKSPQPADNSNFWVVAKQVPEVPMNKEALRAVNFNTHDFHIYYWDGANIHSTCVHVGLAVPGTATYELVNGKCEATCIKGNYLPPACTPPAECTGVPNCEACYAHPKTMCLKCLPHTTQASDNTKCTCPIRECIECPTATLCTRCTKDYKYSAEMNSCFHCTIDKCTVCNSDGQCAACQEGYKLHNNQCVLSVCNIDKCELCKEAGKCAECVADHKPTTDGKKCIHCAPSNCNACRTDDVCGVCDDGYYLIASSSAPKESKCVRCSIDVPKCAACDIEGVCSKCITGHKPTPNGKQCYNCTMPFCTECGADGVCSTCTDGYSLHDNQCVRCSIDKCELCKEAGKCAECGADHKPTTDGKKCIHCAPSNCNACRTDDVCGVCDDGYYLIASSSAPKESKCVRCSIDVPKCEACDIEGVCSKCITGHKPTPNGKQCYNCTMPFCTECGADGVCSTCADGYSLHDNQCVRCRIDVEKCETCKVQGVCSGCIAGHKPTADGKKCFQCPVSGCKECRADGVCIECEHGYTPTMSDNTGTITMCVGCGKEIPHCAACKNEGDCSECHADYKPSADSKNCFHCAMLGCTECRADGVCAKCEDGYSLVASDINPTDNKCVRCPTTENHCEACEADDVCADCKDGYSLVISATNPADNKCVRCAVDVPQCATCETDGVCSKCNDDYKPGSGGEKCFQCTVPGCQECSSDGVCAVCTDGYSLVVSDSTPTENKCVRCRIDVPNCAECKTDGICSTCDDGGYTLSSDGRRCTACVVDECQRCDLPGVCALCSAGMTATDGGQCTPCAIENCTHCSASNVCAVCSCGEVPGDDGEACVPCSAANCRYCDPAGGGTACAECMDGYEAAGDGVCHEVGVADWVVFLIVLLISIALITAVVLVYVWHQRRVVNELRMAADAEERRRNRQSQAGSVRHRTDIVWLDMLDVEYAASGVRDTFTRVVENDLD